IYPHTSPGKDHPLLPERPGVQMRIETQEVAGGRRAASAQPRPATADLPPPDSSRRPHPNSRFCATGTTGAPREGLLFAPLSARSQKRKSLERKPEPRRGDSSEF